MILCDANVCIAGYRKDLAHFEPSRRLLDGLVNGSEHYGWTPFIQVAIVRISTNPAAFNPANSVEQALAYCRLLATSPNAVRLDPTPRHWEIFERVLVDSGVSGKHVTDAYIAALCIEHGCELVTWDKGFSRFKGLRAITPEQALAR
jgi:toxin-antitoxin system PIN domain toxin